MLDVRCINNLSRSEMSSQCSLAIDDYLTAFFSGEASEEPDQQCRHPRVPYTMNLTKGSWVGPQHPEHDTNGETDTAENDGNGLGYWPARDRAEPKRGIVRGKSRSGS